MRRFILALLLCSPALAEVPWPVSTAFTWEIPLWDGSQKVTGASVTASIGKDTDADGVDDQWWTGSAWGAYTALSMTEETGNAHLAGKYKYVLSSGAVGSASNVFIHFSSTYTSSGTTIWNLETLRTTLPTTSAGVAVANLTQIDGQATNGNNATLNLKQLNVQNNAGTAIVANSTGGEGKGIALYGNGGSVGLEIIAGTGALAGMSITGGSLTNSDGILLEPVGSGIPINPAISGGGLTTDESDMLTSIFGKLGSTTITVQSQVASNGTLTLVQGDDYYGTSSLTLTRTAWPGESIVGGTVAFSMMTRAVYDAGTGAAALTGVSCTFTNGTTGSTIVVTIPLTAVQTAALTPSPAQNPLNYVYQVIATTSGGKLHTLFLGAATVKRGAR